ncbi:MAG TPA: GAF domain-containing protein [Anaerolineales bacterium]|nr:GAF domain-containing protein [Anaerolineales bacterium]
MNRRFFHLHENPDPKIRAAFRYASIVTVASLVAFPVESFLAIRTGAWQLWGGTAIILGVLAASLISRQLILNKKFERAAQVLIYSILIGIVANPLLIAGIGIGLGLAGIMLTVVIASRTMERPERLVIISFVVAVVTILLDQLLPPYRLVVPELQLFTPVLMGSVVIILGIMTFRGFRDFSLRTKMIIVIVTIVMVSVGAIALLTNGTLSASLSTNIGNNMSALANSKAIEVRDTVTREVSLLRTMALNQGIQTLVRNTSLQVPLTSAEIQQLDNEWRTASKNNRITWPATALLNNDASSQLRRFQKQFPQNVEVFLTDQQGLILAATNLTSDYYQGDEAWWQIAYRERIYIGQPEYDESTQTLATIIAIAIRDEKSKNVLGILRTTVKFNALVSSLATGLSGETGQVVLYQPSRQELVLEPGEGDTFSVAQKETGFDINALVDSKAGYLQTNHYQTRVLASQAPVSFAEDVSEDSLAVSKLHWRVIVFQELAEALQPVESQTRNLIFIAFIILIAATFVALGLAQVIARPLIRLNAIAEQVAAGDLSAEATVETGDETGTLAKTFNSMTAQLRDLIGTLEHRVAERTKALATSTEVSRHLSTILNERQLVVEVVEQLKAAFDYYHVHIYLVNEASGDLTMAGGTGDAGAALLASGHKVSKGKGLVGRAAQNNVPVLVSDTSKDPGWLPNPLLPDTKSEAAVPIATADRVLGVLDVQHNIINGLQQEDVDLLQSLANQVAIALLNARSYVDIQQRADQEARITSIGLKIKSTTSIEAALQSTARELGRTLGANDIRVILEAPGLARDSQKPD